MNLSLTINEGIEPRRLFTASFNDVYGESNIRHAGLQLEAKKQAGPDPIDLPKRIMSF